MGNSSAEIKGSVSEEAADAASAYHSFWVEVGREAGAKGARFSAGLAQQMGVEQCLESQPLQQQLDFLTATFAPVPAETVGTLCQTKANPSRMTTAVFTKRDVMASSWSF
jgi:hypothetical protein